MVLEQLEQKHRRSYSWWFDSHKSPRQSPWLLSTLSELEEKTTKMLKLIEEDADSFAKRAEMYYKKRPELVNMVEDFYRAHRSLAEQFDQLKLEAKTRHTTPLGSPTKACWLQNLTLPFDNFYSTLAPSESEESEIDDPEDGGEIDNGDDDSLKNTQQQKQQEEDKETTRLKKMTEELEKLREENKILTAQLEEKDEQKREVIRQLTSSMNVLSEENVALKKRLVGDSNKGSFDLTKFLFGAWPGGKLFSNHQSKSSRTTLVAL